MGKTGLQASILPFYYSRINRIDICFFIPYFSICALVRARAHTHAHTRTHTHTQYKKIILEAWNVGNQYVCLFFHSLSHSTNNNKKKITFHISKVQTIVKQLLFFHF